MSWMCWRNDSGLGFEVAEDGFFFAARSAASWLRRAAVSCIRCRNCLAFTVPKQHFGEIDVRPARLRQLLNRSGWRNVGAIVPAVLVSRLVDPLNAVSAQ